VRLHALRDYFGMAYLVSQHPDVHVTVNFSPILLWQLEDYLERGGTDRALQLSRKRTSYLTSAERRELLETFFDAHWHHQIYPYPRYRDLLEHRVQGRRFSMQDLTDLKMWFNLAWFAQEFRAGDVTLPDGATASVQRFVEQGSGFTQRDIEVMLAEQDKILRHILPLHRRLQERGQIEVSVSPYGHPILPLLMDTDLATLDRAGATLPARFTHPEDAEAHVAMAMACYREHFGREPRGMWPAEGAVAEAMVPLLGRHGFRWIATDEGVLARSGRYGYRVEDPRVLCQPYQALNPARDGAVSLLFRNRQLSDAIGFHYQSIPDPEQAAQAFVVGVKGLAQDLQGERDYLVPVILDGENAWGSYRDDGRPFLHALYGALAADAEIKTVTISEYLDGNADRRLPPHPAAEQPRVYDLYTGSWSDELDSAPGVDLGTWIGEPEENAAWELLGAVRRALKEAGARPNVHPDAFRALYAAEGSDWFWWFGADHQSEADEAFDDLFRSHLKAACQLAGIEPVPEIDRHIVSHRVIWTFTVPVDEIQAGDQLIVRTNCPGILTWSLDGCQSLTESPLNPVGGVMAGACRYAVTLGPFPAGTTLGFHFRCQYPGCTGDDACCRGREQTVKVVEKKRS
jgi:alpha-amylase/alpha-mannosidase (GH57 family)